VPRPLKLASGRGPEDLVFGSKPSLPFNPQSVTRRADAAWTAAGLERLELHEGRHTFASLLIRVGIGAKEVAAYMGHASIQTTFDLYGKLFERSSSRMRAGSTRPSAPQPSECPSRGTEFPAFG
jgi:integrase